jgi:hypothetical protein
VLHKCQAKNSDDRKHQIPNSDRALIFGGVMAFGGQYRMTLEPDVTHVVSLESTGSVYEEALQRSHTKIVLPHYFDDCFRIKRWIPEDIYSFPDKKLLTEDPFSFLTKPDPGMLLKCFFYLPLSWMFLTA